LTCAAVSPIDRVLATPERMSNSGLPAEGFLPLEWADRPLCRLAFNNLSNAVDIDSHRLIFPKVEQHAVIARRANFPRFCKRILRAIIEPDRKRSERFTLRDLFDVLNLHAQSLVPGNSHRNNKTSNFSGH
jgi:hypothetical protein